MTAMNRRETRRPSAGNLSSRGGFSLLELLITMGCVVILAGLLLPAIQSAAKKVRATRCVSNMRQLGAGLFCYLADNDQNFPNAYIGQQHWYQDASGQLGEYLGVKWRANADYWKGSILNCSEKKGGYLGKSMNYTYNYNLPTLYKKPVVVKYPNRTVAFAENFSYAENTSTFFFFGRWTQYDPGNSGIDWKSHNGCSNVLFVDGHVAAIPGADQSNNAVIIYDPRQE